MSETWKTIPSNPHFAVSSLGRVKAYARKVRFVDKLGVSRWRLKREKLVASQRINSGYLIVHFSVDCKRVARTVHSLVAEAFIGPRPPNAVVSHRNNVKTDNRIANLRYCTQSENLQQMVCENRHSTPGAKLTKQQVRKIRSLKESKASDLAAQFSVHVNQIYRIRNYENWHNL